jgi:hypothetical protein
MSNYATKQDIQRILNIISAPPTVDIVNEKQVQDLIDNSKGEVQLPNAIIKISNLVLKENTIYKGPCNLVLDNGAISVGTIRSENSIPGSNDTTHRIRNIELRDINFYDAVAGNYGILIRNIEGFRMVNCKYFGKYKTGVAGNGIVIAGIWDSTGAAVPAGLGADYYTMPKADQHSKGIEIINCEFEHTAIQFVACDGVEVSKCSFLDGHFNLLVDFLNRNVLIRDNYIEATKSEWQVFSASPDSAIYVGQGSHNVTIDNNRFIERHTNVYCECVNSVNVTNNYFKATNGNTCLWVISETLFGVVLGSSNVKLIGNEIQGFIYGGICGTVANASKNVCIEGNSMILLDVAAAAAGIFYNTTECCVRKNNIVDGKICELYSTSNGIIQDNVCSLTTDRVGVFFDATDHGLCRVISNRIIGSTSPVNLNENQTRLIIKNVVNTNVPEIVLSGTANSAQGVISSYDDYKYGISSAENIEARSGIVEINGTAPYAMTTSFPTAEGQEIWFVHTIGANAITNTISGLSGGTTVTVSVGDSYKIRSVSNLWFIVENNGAVVA